MNQHLLTASFDLYPIVDLEGILFVVEDYQRGYKWSCREVLDLLTDIDDFPTEKDIYCIQPIVVKKLPPKPEQQFVYELIDGQQRMTTIFMILAALGEVGRLFDISYNTRTQSRDFLRNSHKIPLVDISWPDFDDPDELEDNISQEWFNHLQQNREVENDNVDNFHFYRAHQTILLWLDEKDDDERQVFRTKLLNNVQVIWYQVPEDEVSERIFININSGKIALTNAELIKALFLIDCRKEDNEQLSQLLQNEIAHEWDIIEYHLQNNEFWFFINDEQVSQQVPTRIDLIFDLLTEKKKGNNDPYFAYRKYARDVKNQTKLNWQEVKEMFERLLEWFEDRDIFHLTGYLIARKFSDLKTLLNLNREKGKNDFKEALKNIVRKKFKQEKDGALIYSLDNLNFNHSKKEALDVLLLFNIETYHKHDASFRFPFHRFKKQSWSIEHIHAQQSKQFTQNAEVIEWHTDIVKLLEDLAKNDSMDFEKILHLKQEITPFSQLDATKELTKDIKNQLELVSEQLEIFLDVHNISNLALLDQATNSSIGNNIFLKKRSEIMTIDKSGEAIVKNRKVEAFIPICTKNAFVKYYTKDEKQIQMSYWGYQDREDYRDALKTVLRDFYK